MRQLCPRQQRCAPLTAGPTCIAARLQIYYELAAERAKQGKQGEVAVIRMEQLAPFPYDLVSKRPGG